MRGGRLPRLHSETPSLKPKDWGVHLMVECLPSMYKALNSITRTTTKQKKLLSLSSALPHRKPQLII